MRLESFTILAALGSFAEGALPAHAQSSARLEMRAASAATLFGAVLIFEDGFESEDTCLWSPGCAVVRINEVNGNIDSGCDLMELRVVAGGTMDGFRLRERDADSFTFTGLTVATNDLVVVHWNGNSATCNPNASPNETISITQHPAATFAANYDTAYDWYTSDSGITSTDNVLTLYRSGGAIADAVFVANDTSGSAATGTETQAAAVAAAGEWEMVGGGIPPGDSSTTTSNSTLPRIWMRQDPTPPPEAPSNAPATRKPKRSPTGEWSHSVGEVSTSAKPTSDRGSATARPSRWVFDTLSG